MGRHKKVAVAVAGDLDFLKLGIRPPLWEKEKIRALVEHARSGMKHDDIARLCNIKLTQVKNVLGELRKAAINGYTLDRYLNEGRPLGYWKKKI